MENLSIMVWNKLSRFIGIEEQIFIRRRKKEISNCIVSRGFATDAEIPISFVFSGSFAEGMVLPGSDIDVMVVLDSISVSDSYTHHPSVMIMDTTNIKPGFVRLRCYDNISYPFGIFSALVETDNGLVLSSLLFRDTVVNLLQLVNPSSVGHGPCSTFVVPLYKIDGDLLICFSCKTWPVVANEWIGRNRNNNWPPRDLISDIERDGCLIVPIGNPSSQDSYVQWRISFSIAEKKLFDSINHTQFLCYTLLKLYLRHVINSNTEIKDLICSYFLKTCLFYCIEEECIIWNKENFLNCFWTCFRRLIKWVKEEYCPNYFIKENNMFEGKVCGEKGRILLSHLGELYHEGLDSLWRIPCLSELQHCTMHTPVLIGNAITNAEREFFGDLEFNIVHANTYGDEHLLGCIRILVVLADMVQNSTSNLDKTILTITHYRTVNSLVQRLFQQVCTNDSNKNIYKHMKKIESLIVNDCMSIDKGTGMLLLATLFYLKGKYKEVVTIVQKVVKKLKCSVIYMGLKDTRVCNLEAYMSEVVGKGLTLFQKFNSGIFAFVYSCIVDCMFYPSEIEREIVEHSELNHITYINPWVHSELNMTYINPFVYSYVLMFLSYFRMNSRQDMIDTLSELYSTVYDRMLEDDLEFPLAISLLEKCINLFE